MCRTTGFSGRGVVCMQIPPRVSTEHVRVLLVGERGGGKTTLWRNLLASYAGAQVTCPLPIEVHACLQHDTPDRTSHCPAMHASRSGYCMRCCKVRRYVHERYLRLVHSEIFALHALIFCYLCSLACASWQKGPSVPWPICAQVFREGPAASTSLDTFRRRPADLATNVAVRLSETCTLVYTLQEAPG